MFLLSIPAVFSEGRVGVGVCIPSGAFLHGVCARVRVCSYVFEGVWVCVVVLVYVCVCRVCVLLVLCVRVCERARRRFMVDSVLVVKVCVPNRVFRSLALFLSCRSVTIVERNP